MASDDLLTYRQILEALRRYCADKVTGTLMIATPDNQLARVSLDSGEIVGLAFGGKQGAEVAPLIAGIKAARIRFSGGKAGATHEGGALPPTAALFKMLAGNVADVPAASAPARPPAAAASVLKVIEDELIEFLGPLGAMVLQERVAQVGDLGQAGAVQRLVDAVAKEIRDPDKVLRFKERVAARLRG